MKFLILRNLVLALTFLSVKAVDDLSGSNNDGIWIVPNTNSSEPCLMVQMDIALNVTYNNLSAIYHIPSNAKVNETASKCDKNEELLSVYWDGNNFEMMFRMTNATYDLSSFNITLDGSKIFNNTSNITINIQYTNEESLFKTPANFSYHCNREQKLNNHIEISKVQFEAFKLSKGNSFSLAKDCDSSNVVNDIVPIAVGLALVSLIIIVLIAYIVGRRRQQARGYLNLS